ncbi:MAG: peptide-methionine (S)-S-oxide reductase MsrA [Spirochaetaceae bacterium]|jgi:peptide methionine sulfoxide reductase msrA/msrB|nr:peptide-methionine (S)-S-oxide reductase MsrA [Spirochaetaceae bacterium]
MKTIYIAAGCFWGAEKYFSLIRGVYRTEVGYANGKTENPSYEEVKHRETGHAETVLVEYDPRVISLSFLLDLYYEAVDPTSLNRQGADVGTQYRTGIYYTDEEDLPVIQKSLEKLREKLGVPAVIEVKPLKNYYPAEEYHQKYLDKNPGGYCHITPSQFNRAKAAQPTPSG